MLKLIDVTKDYKTAGSVVHALKGVNLRFRKNEFVSVLGASGCGKTTLLNIIGGLDHYTAGDLVINGVSTKQYKDHDWDVYRNHRVGFVFQSYNLIPHQTVLGNVEIALTIAGISKAERRARATEALRRVGLEKELKKRPNQLSGGQMQRVAIARALVNNPEILLADEPTGALDSETSVQIMDLIREISGERLVIMVTHNPELAREYSNRIVSLHDGLVVSDSNPYEVEEAPALKEEQQKALQVEEDKKLYLEVLEPTVEGAAKSGRAVTAKDIDGAVKKEKKKKKQDTEKRERSSMSFKTSLGLSARNLAMKKGRTIVTSIAGSIGIISVCLVLALSNGFNSYIKKTQEDMLSSSPLQIQETSLDPVAIMAGLSTAGDMPDLSQIGNRVYVNSFLTNVAQGMTVSNDISDEYINYLESMDEGLSSAIVYDTGMRYDNNLFTEVTVNEGDKNVAGEKAVMSLSQLKAYYTMQLATFKDDRYADLAFYVDYLGSVYNKMPGTADVNAEDYGDYVLSQYELVDGLGHFPKASNEAVLVVGANNDMTDLTLAQLGILTEQQFLSLFPGTDEDGNRKEVPDMMLDFEEYVLGKKYTLYYNDAVYTPSVAQDSSYLYDYSGMRATLDADEKQGVEITITGVLRLKEGMNYGCLGQGGLYFTEQLYNEYLATNMQSQIVTTMRAQAAYVEKITSLQKQMALYPAGSAEITALAEEMSALITEGKDKGMFKRVAASVQDSYKQATQFGINTAGNETLAEDLKSCWFAYGDDGLRRIGGISKPNTVSIYTDSFDSKEQILNYLDEWNNTHESEQQVKYTDTVGLMLSMVETILNAITYVLVAFTAISLIVSSVMIGIITYVSVVERVKEIGVLRALGARKKDIKNLFNAETFIIGLASGVFGVVVTYLLSMAVNAILGDLTGIATLASLPVLSAVIMVVISIVLTLISGLIPARAAAKKDPVVALRTE